MFCTLRTDTSTTAELLSLSLSLSRSLEYIFRLERGAWWIIEMIVQLPLLTHTTWGRRMLDNKVEQLDKVRRQAQPRSMACEMKRGHMTMGRIRLYVYGVIKAEV